ncbi:MAG: hypothetical protein R6X29_00620 [Acidimicrobiia bacterium]|jgi:hypothetical protein
MTRTHARTATIVLLVVAMLAIAVPVFAGRSVERPIREDLSGYIVGIEFAPNFPAHAGVTFGGRCSVPSQWISTMSGTGTISHLGRVSWTTEHCFQLFAGTFNDAELVITAANGDKLFATYKGVMTGETTYVETMVITGGTGRFAGATGTVDETGWFDPGTGYMEVTGRGTITYDSSNLSAMK